MNPAALEKRLVRLEAEAEIRNLVTLYGLAADCGDTETAAACHTETATYIVSAPGAGRSDARAHDAPDLILEGREAIRAMLNSDLHQSLIPDCAHTAGPITLAHSDAAMAHAVGYSRLYRAEGDKVSLMRLAINHWRFEQPDGRWRIAHRTSRILGDQAARTLIRDMLPDLAASLPSGGQ